LSGLKKEHHDDHRQVELDEMLNFELPKMGFTLFWTHQARQWLKSSG